MSTAACTCQTCKCVIGKPDATIACSFCQKDLYCSEDCKQLGWSIHQDECNVWEAPEANVTVFLDKNDKTNHIVRHVNPSGYIEQHVVIGDSVTKCNCEEPSKDGKYSMQIELNGEEICNLQGKELLENSIYTSALGMGGKIAKSKEFTAQNPLVLWPGKLELESPQEDCGLIRVKVLNEDGKLISSVAGLYDLEDVTSVHLPAKNLRNAQVLKARDANENYCELTFVDQRLVDVEYHLSSLDPLAQGAKFDSEKIEFMCDPRDIDHVNGLIMAMEDKGGASRFHQFDIINQYREGLEAGTLDGPSPKINGAIQMAQRELWDQIGLRNPFRGLSKYARASKRYLTETRAIEKGAKNKTFTQADFDKKFRGLLDELTRARRQKRVGSVPLRILEFMVDEADGLGYVLDDAMVAEYWTFVPTEKQSRKEKMAMKKPTQNYEVAGQRV